MPMLEGHLRRVAQVRIEAYDLLMPLLAVAALAATFTLHAGQAQVLPHARAGDIVVCKSATDVIRWKATRRNVGTASWVWNKSLQLNITSKADGRLAASCARR
jgi:hypothetical protein